MNLPYYIYRFRYNHGQNLFLTKPVDISLELSSFCQLRCDYCYHSKKTLFKKAFMPLDVALNIIDDASQIGVHSLKFNWRGEPTLYPHLERVTNFARELATGMTFMDRVINSNFQFDPSNESIFNALCNSTKVKASFDSFTKSVFERQRKQGKWLQIFENIKAFHDHPKRKNTKLIIQAVRTNFNKDEDIDGESKKHFPDAEISIRDMVTGRVSGDLKSLVTKIPDTSERLPCKQAFVRLVFNHQGKAFPCCPDIKEEICLGNIETSSVEEIFNSPKARGLRKALKNKTAFLENPCLNCSSFESYKNYTPSWDS